MIVLVLVLPGVFYQTVRERLRGQLPAEQEPQNRLARALAVGALLDAVYAVVAGPWLVRRLTGGGRGPVAGLAAHPRESGLAALLFVVLVPSLVAWGEAVLTARRLRARYDPVPTAWDALFRDRSSCFVRARLKSGLWVGGWLGSRSAVATYPQEPDLYLQAQYRMGPDGEFLDRVEQTGGVYLRAADIEVLEIVQPPRAVPAQEAPEAQEVQEGEQSGTAAGTAL
jgi:hypothetical protein